MISRLGRQEMPPDQKLRTELRRVTKAAISLVDDARLLVKYLDNRELPCKNPELAVLVEHVKRHFSKKVTR